MIFHSLLKAFSLALCLLFMVVAFPFVAVSSAPPEGLTLREWRDVRAQIREAAYHAEPAKAGEAEKFTAANRSHGFSAAFARDAVRFSESQGKRSDGWNLSLKAARYGYGDNLKPVPDVTEVRADGNKVEYLRGDMTEWYVNDVRGVEQWFTLKKRPEAVGDGPLRIEMALDGDLIPRLSDDRQAVLFQNAAKNSTVKYHKLKVWDSNGKRMPSRMDVAEGSISLVIDDRDAVYPLTIDPLVARETKLNRLYSDAEDEFGTSIAVDGDIMVVGAPYANRLGDLRKLGAAFIFEKNGPEPDDWAFARKIMASDGGEGDEFGRSVAISGDLVVVGAPLDDDEFGNSGSVYLYDRSNGWAETKLRCSDPAELDHFGNSVAIDGDLLVVGARYKDDGGYNSGSVYLFDRSQAWAETKLTASDAGKNDWFGYAVSVYGDLVVVGAPLEDDAFTDSGSVYVFDRSVEWSETKLKASDAGESDRFGYAVSVYAGQVLVGAPLDDNEVTDSGSAYVYDHFDGWAETKLIASNSNLGDQYGHAVAVRGDLFVVGASRKNASSGIAYAYDRSNGWSETILKTSTLFFYSSFGNSVCVGSDDVFIGAFRSDASGYNSGAVYAYTPSKEWSVKQITASTATDVDYFGGSVAIGGELVAVGAVYDDDDGSQSGSVYVYDLSRGWMETKLTAPDGAPGNYFGYSVAVDGDLVVVGARNDYKNGESSGSAYVFDRSRGWAMITKLKASDGRPGDEFGVSVSISGDFVVVGAPHNDDRGESSGSTYVYDRSQGWKETKLLASDGKAGDEFGDSVSISGDLCVVGAPRDPYDLEYPGSAYVYDRSSGWRETKLTPSDEPEVRQFGASVSVDGDLVAVGMPFGDSNLYSVYVFERSAGWAETKLAPSDIVPWTTFASIKVSVSGDLVALGVNQDLFSGSLLLSTYYRTSYVFNRAQGWAETRLIASDGEIEDSFGNAIGISRDRVVVGSLRDDDGGNATGSAYVFELNETPSAVSIQPAPVDPARPDLMSFHVAFSENVAGVDVGDFSLSTVGSATGTISEVTENTPTDYTVIIAGITGEGSLTLRLADNDTIVDEMGAPLGGPEAGNGDFFGPPRIVGVAPTIYASPFPVPTTTPTWYWSGLSSLGGTGLFRFKLDDDDLENGAIQTADTEFTPSSALSQGVHTLYLQEKDDTGNWSAVASGAIEVKSPPQAVLTSDYELTVNEPEGEGEFTIRLAVQPSHPVILDLFSANTEICLVDPSRITLDSENWDIGETITVRDAPTNIINSQTVFVAIKDAVSEDPYFNGKSANPVTVTVADDAAFAVHSISPKYGVSGEYTAISVMGAGFDENVQVSYQQQGGGLIEPTFSLFGSTLITFNLPDDNQAAPPSAGAKYTVIVANEEMEFQETVTIVSKEDLEALKRKKAIIVAGGGLGYDGDYLWPATQYCTEKAKEALEVQGYLPGSIRLLSAESPLPQSAATRDNLQFAITQWATEPLETGYEIDELIIYMTGHGLFEQFFLDGWDKYVNPAAIRSWIDELQNANPGLRVIFFLDACLAGSFIEPMKADPSAPYERILIASTEAKANAIFAETGHISFSESFWNSARTRGLLYNAYKAAEWDMLGFGQQAQIVIPEQYTFKDKDLKMGLGLVSATSSVEIGKILPNSEEGIDSICEDSFPIWAWEITPPNVVLDSVGAWIRFQDRSTEPLTTLRFLPMAKVEYLENEISNQSSQSVEEKSWRYKGVFENLDRDGIYYIDISARLAGGQGSGSIHTKVRRLCGEGGIKGDVNNDREVDIADAIIALQVLAGIEEAPVRPDYALFPDLDVNGDTRVGLAEAVYALRQAIP